MFEWLSFEWLRYPTLEFLLSSIIFLLILILWDLHTIIGRLFKESNSYPTFDQMEDLIEQIRNIESNTLDIAVQGAEETEEERLLKFESPYYQKTDDS